MSVTEAENILAGCCISFLNLEDFAQKRRPMDEDREFREILLSKHTVETLHETLHPQFSGVHQVI